MLTTNGDKLWPFAAVVGVPTVITKYELVSTLDRGFGVGGDAVGSVVQDGSAEADGPGFVAVEDDAFEAVGDAGVDLGPCRAGVSGSNDDAVIADGPAFACVYEENVVQIRLDSRVLRSPQPSAAGRCHDQTIRSDGPAELVAVEKDRVKFRVHSAEQCRFSPQKAAVLGKKDRAARTDDRAVRAVAKSAAEQKKMVRRFTFFPGFAVFVQFVKNAALAERRAPALLIEKHLSDALTSGIFDLDAFPGLAAVDRLTQIRRRILPACKNVAFAKQPTGIFVSKMNLAKGVGREFGSLLPRRSAIGRRQNGTVRTDNKAFRRGYKCNITEPRKTARPLLHPFRIRRLNTKEHDDR